MKMKKILAATNNVGKLKEIKEILKDFEILSLKDINCEIEVEEDGKTFEENSREILEGHNAILNTSGVRQIPEIFQVHKRLNSILTK